MYECSSHIVFLFYKFKLMLVACVVQMTMLEQFHRKRPTGWVTTCGRTPLFQPSDTQWLENFRITEETLTCRQKSVDLQSLSMTTFRSSLLTTDLSSARDQPWLPPPWQINQPSSSYHALAWPCSGPRVPVLPRLILPASQSCCLSTVFQ